MYFLMHLQRRQQHQKGIVVHCYFLFLFFGRIIRAAIPCGCRLSCFFGDRIWSPAGHSVLNLRAFSERAAMGKTAGKQEEEEEEEMDRQIGGVKLIL